MNNLPEITPVDRDYFNIMYTRFGINTIKGKIAFLSRHLGTEVISVDIPDELNLELLEKMYIEAGN